MRKSIMSAAILLPALALGACGSPAPVDNSADADIADPGAMTAADTSETPMQAVAMLRTTDGTDVGTVTATPEGNAVHLSINAMGMPAGEHGIHVHTTGSCTPAFDAAGGHWNPEDNQHGLEAAQGQHAGDMPNLDIGVDGTGTLEYTLGGGATFAGLMEGDGSAMIVHAMADDEKTDPSGDSGDRIACGVFAASGSGMASPAPATGSTS